MRVCGIDPGLDGAIAFIINGRVTAGAMPTTALHKGRDIDGVSVKNLLLTFKPELVVIESVHALPGQGVTSMFTFGKGYGRLLGICEALGIPYELVRPDKWKKAMSVFSDKSSSIHKCKQLFPDVNLKATSRCKKDHDGMAEAVLLAEYGRRFCGSQALDGIYQRNSRQRLRAKKYLLTTALPVEAEDIFS